MRKVRPISLSQSVTAFRTALIPGLLVTIAISALSAQPIKTATTISGTAVDEKGTPVQANVTVIALGFTQQKFTAPNGAFVFSPVPAGAYLLCGEALPKVTLATTPGSDRPLDSCAWLDVSSPKITIAAGELRSGVKVTVKQGRLITVRVNDPQKLLPPKKGQDSGNELSLTIAGPTGFVRRIPILAEDANGRTHGIVVPYDTPHQLSIQSTTFSLTDQSDRDFSALAPLAIQATRLAPETQYVVNVKAKGAK